MQSNKNPSKQLLNTLIILTYFIILILVIVIIYAIYKVYNKNEKFENPSNTEAAAPAPNYFDSKMYPDGQPPNMNNTESENCNSALNLSDICINFKNCCKANAPVGVSCYCANSNTVKCNNEVNECLKTKSKDECTSQLKSCCQTVNNINVEISKFKEPVKAIQKSYVLCNLGVSNNVEQKCMELCQIDDNCKSFYVDDTTCSLFTKVDNTNPELNKKANKNSKYFVKK
jgi:hypothetical protein